MPFTPTVSVRGHGHHQKPQSACGLASYAHMCLLGADVDRANLTATRALPLPYSVDVDRADYLLRDAQRCGVRLRSDIRGLLQSARVSSKPVASTAKKNTATTITNSVGAWEIPGVWQGPGCLQLCICCTRLRMTRSGLRGSCG